MTSTVTQVTIANTTSSSYETLSATLGGVVILLLLVLLVQKEFMRVLGDRRSRRWMQTLNIAIVPLMLTSGFVIVTRFLAILLS